MPSKDQPAVFVYISCSLTKRWSAGNHLALGPSASPKNGDPLADVMGRWQKAVENTPTDTRVRAVDLYGGGIWKQLRNEHAALRKEGIELRIVSAGLGLLASDDFVPAYDATFAPGAENAIGGVRGAVQRNRDWWALLSRWEGPWAGPRSLHASVRKYSNAAHVFALPSDYMDAVLDDLEALVSDEECRSRTIVLATPTSAALRRIPKAVDVPGDLYAALGGTRGTVLARAGLYLAHKLHRRAGNAETAKETLRPLRALIRPLPVRTGRTDAEITKFIAAALTKNPKACASPLLAQFRIAGFACEQSRFRQLHKAVNPPL